MFQGSSPLDAENINHFEWIENSSIQGVKIIAFEFVDSSAMILEGVAFLTALEAFQLATVQLISYR